MWILLGLLLSTIAIRFGGWIVGIQLSWATSVLIAGLALLGLLIIIGVVTSIGERAQDETEAQERPTIPVSRENMSKSRRDECVRVFYDEQRKRRVRILVRDTGTFYFQEEYVREEASERFWIPVGERAIGFYDSEETAIREARANVDWLPAL